MYKKSLQGDSPEKSHNQIHNRVQILNLPTSQIFGFAVNFFPFFRNLTPTKTREQKLANILFISTAYYNQLKTASLEISLTFVQNIGVLYQLHIHLNS